MFEGVLAWVDRGRVPWESLAAQGLGLPHAKPGAWRTWVCTEWVEWEGMTLHWAHVVVAAVVRMRRSE